jgi:Ca2+-binding RTX toxin-like protein
MTRAASVGVLTKVGLAIAIAGLLAVAYSVFATRSAAAAAQPTCRGVTATIVGTSGPDKVEGTAGRDVIVTKGGGDDVEGRGGNDLVCAGDGNDKVEGDAGNDRIFGGSGNDELEGKSGADVLNGGRGFDKGQGGLGVDTCVKVEQPQSC